MNQKRNSLLRPISPKGKTGEVSLSAFSFLLSELLQYSHTRVNNMNDLERRVSSIGSDVGVRILEATCFREKNNKRENKLVGILNFISNTIWKVLFGKQADSLERAVGQDDEYMITENQSVLINKFISIPQNSLNPAYFVAGIVEGILNASDFPATVSAHLVSIEGQRVQKTVILIKFNSPPVQ